MQRLNQARQKAEELSKEKSRLTGELDTYRKRLAEEEQKCLKEFECSIEELPELIDSFKTEAENNLAKAEFILGLRTDNPEVESPAVKQVESKTITPTPVTSTLVTPIRKVVMPKKPITTVSSDDDGI